jgi:hypothetical protein
MSFVKDSSFLVPLNKNDVKIQDDIGELSLFCAGCNDPINSFSNSSDQQIVNANGETYHSSCFV